MSIESPQHGTTPAPAVMASVWVYPSSSGALDSRGAPCRHDTPRCSALGRGSFLAPQVPKQFTSHIAPTSNRPAPDRLVINASRGGPSRPSWTEAAAGIGRGRTQGEARAVIPPKQGKGQTSDPDAAGKASREAAASADTKRGGGNTTRGGRGVGVSSAGEVGRGRGTRAGRGTRGTRGGRGSPIRGSATQEQFSGTRYSAEKGGAAARAAAKNAEKSSYQVTERNVDLLLESDDDWYAQTVSESSKESSTASVTYSGTGFRLVRCMPHLRRREADDAVSAGRVLVNGALVKPSRRVISGDVVTLDNKKMDWEPFAESTERGVEDASGDFIYLKYHKPRGVTCTMEPSQKSSMLYALKDELNALTKMRRKKNPSGMSKQSAQVRLFPVGRLDRDSSGLVLLTDDGRVPEALLDPQRKAPKIYEVDVDGEVSDSMLNKLKSGVAITTTQQRDGVETTAATLPCEVGRIPTTPGAHSVCALRFTLKEGRNRQIRKMCEVVGVEVTRLHRVSTGEVTLRIDDESDDFLETGGVRRVTGTELSALAKAVEQSVTNKRSGSNSAKKEAPDGWGRRIRDGV